MLAKASGAWLPGRPPGQAQARQQLDSRGSAVRGLSDRDAMPTTVRREAAGEVVDPDCPSVPSHAAVLVLDQGAPGASSGGGNHVTTTLPDLPWRRDRHGGRVRGVR